MTPEQMDSATRRLQFLEKSGSLPAETIRDLKLWWREKILAEKKIIPFRKGDEKYETFEEMRPLR